MRTLEELSGLFWDNGNEYQRTENIKNIRSIRLEVAAHILNLIDQNGEGDDLDFWQYYRNPVLEFNKELEGTKP